jgi:opacity protein-like surface antigen
MKNLLAIILVFFISAVEAQDAVIPVKVLNSSKAGPEQYLGADSYGWQYTVLDNELRKEKEGQMLKFKAISTVPIYRTLYRLFCFTGNSILL